MRRKFHILLSVLALLGWALGPAEARGRRPDDEDDTLPDYNRLEMHPKKKEDAAAADTGKAANPVPADLPALTGGANHPPVDDTTPQPPPKVVPVPEDSSEPPLPDAIKDTLVPSATGQK